MQHAVTDFVFIKFYWTHLIFNHTGQLGLELYMKLEFRCARVEGFFKII